jgi:hypothetical protein
MLKRILQFLSLLVVLSVALVAYAGTLTAPAGTPAATSYTLGDIYSKLLDFSDSATEADHNLTSSASPAASLHTLKEIYELLSDEDSDLVAGNIADGVEIFGVTGTLEAGASAGILKTGQTKCTIHGAHGSCSGSNQDGESQRGIAHSYTSNAAAGTVLDNATGLMWHRCTAGRSGTDCSTGSVSDLAFDNGATYPAIAFCESSTQGGFTDWHLANVNELFSLINFNNQSPAIDTTAFQNFPGGYYWTATANTNAGHRAWLVNFDQGTTEYSGADGTARVLCVRQP